MMMNFTSTGVVTVLLSVLAYIKAEICDLNCGPGYNCAMTRSTCTYPPCPYFPTCIANEDVSLPGGGGNSISRPGQCPAPTGLGPCINSCRSDGDCSTSQKCCNNGCGRTCRTIVSDVIEKPGTCARRLDAIVTTCQQECDTDLDCSGVQKCCRTSCAAVCSDPCYYWLAPNQRSSRKGIIWKLPFFCRL